MAHVLTSSRFESAKATSDPARISAFFEACRFVVKEDQLLDSSYAQERYGTNSLNVTRIIAGAVVPRNQAEIVAVVKLANEFQVGLYTISVGHNWGYGGATPHRDHCVILDLHRMQRIISVDSELGVAVVEPGVTTGILYDYLQANKLEYLVPVTGAGPNTSLIGNAMERGFGLVPISDHNQALMSITAVLADGTIYNSALAANTQSDIGNLYKWGVGPYIDGLFSQGNYGIVTQASIMLQPKPAAVTLMTMDLRAEHPDEAVHFIRDMTKRYGKNLSNFQILNRNRYASTVPHGRLDKLPDWRVFGAIYGDKDVVKTVKRGLKRYKRPALTHRKFYSMNALLWFGRHYRKLPKWMQSSRIEYSLVMCNFMLGKPTETFVRQVIYDGSIHAQLNPDRDHKGVMWYAPLIPLRASNVRQFLEMAKRVLEQHHFPCNITLVSFGGLCLDGTLLLKYDRNNPDDCERAKRCYAALFQGGMQIGVTPYRVGVQGMKLLVDETQPFWQLARTLKHALDPNNILSPGRYNLD